MRRFTLALCFISLTTLLHAIPLTVQNFSFETGNLTQVGNGTFSQLIPNSTIFAQGGTLGSWTASSTTTGAAAGGFAPSPGGNNWTTSWWDGNNIGYVQINQPGNVSLSQVLSDNLLNSTIYTLTVDVGRRTFTPVFSCSIELWAGTTVLNSSPCPALPNNSSGSQTVIYSSGASNPLAGQALKIVLGSSNAGTAFTEAFWDRVRLDAVTTGAVPEPASIGLIGAGVFLLFAIRRLHLGC
jgi:hypothetical protein